MSLAPGSRVGVYEILNLFRGRYMIRDGTLGRHYEVSADGRFLMLKEQRNPDQGHFVVVQNWTSELRRAVP